jgi:cytochrome P450
MTTAMTKAPGPPGTFGLRNSYRLSSNPLRFLREMADEHGDVVQMSLVGTPWFMLNHPADIEQALVKLSKSMGRDAYVEVLERTLGLGLLTADGELWKRQRKLMAQAFTPKRIESYAETMVEVADAGLPWRDGDTINIHDEMSRLAMEVVAKVLFGTGIEADDVELVHDSMETVAAFYANTPEAIAKIPAWVPTPRNVALKNAVARIDGLIYRIIAERRRGEAREDLLGTLLAACDDDGDKMSDQQLRDEAVTLFLAGHETTALALAHTLYVVSKHPHVVAQLQQEVDEVLGGALPDHRSVRKLSYTERVIKEGMRLYPPAWTTGREALEDVEIGGYHIPKGSQLLMSQWIVHRDPRWFPNPEAFDPDRWKPERTEALPRYGYFPFGGGPRVCIGNHFAMMEATLLLAIVVQRFSLELLPGQQLDLMASVTLRAKKGMRMRVRARPAPRVTKAVPTAAVAGAA